MDPEQINDAIGLIYDVAVDTAGWPVLLAKLGTMYNCHFVDSFQRAEDYSWFHGIAHGLDRDDYENVFLGFWVKRNVWGKRRPVRRAGDVLVTREMTPVVDLLRSEMYNEFLNPRGLHEGLRMDIWAGNGWVEDISMLRPWSSGRFTAEEIRAAHALVPHLQRATAVSRRLRGAADLALAGLAALERLHTAVVLVTRSGRLVYANAAAQALLARNDGIMIADGVLGCANPSVAGAFQAVVEAACDPAGQGGRSGALRIPRPLRRPALAMIALPLRAEALEFDLSRRDEPAALVCISDPMLDFDLKPLQLMELFGLTQAESSLATDLLAGLELREIADSSGRSINTMRTHLARLMAKTETRRQSDLVRLLSRLPRMDQ